MGQIRLRPGRLTTGTGDRTARHTADRGGERTARRAVVHASGRPGGRPGTHDHQRRERGPEHTLRDHTHEPKIAGYHPIF
ncbi:hypothetical protein GCM10017562_33270 [Streptomyces roseofulvus]